MEMKIGLIGCGAIGSVIAKAMDRNPKIHLEVLMEMYIKKAEKLKDLLKNKPQITDDFDEFMKCDWSLGVEAASQEAANDYGYKILEKGDLMIMSVGALADDGLRNKLYSRAKKFKRKFYIPSGAIAGVDAVKSASVAKIHEVILTTSKNPKSLGRSDKKRKVIYEGFAREAAQLFPANINVSITLSLAGIGPDKTKVRIVSDPAIKRNIHEIRVKGEFGELITKTKNLPSPTNPKTSYLAALSAVKTLEKIVESTQIGT